MALIRPFRGIRYNPAVVGDLRQVVSPPYDVISEQQQALLHMQSPYNAVHLDLNQDTQRYTVAAKTWQEWRQKEVLLQDPEPSLYVYSQDFTVPDPRSKDAQTRRRTGILSAVQLEEFASGKVRPHERTFERAKSDRLALLRACQAHLSPVFLLYAKKDWSLEQMLAAELTAPPVLDVMDALSNRNRLWRVTDPQRIAEVTNGLVDDSLIIADGHHRYETALQYRRERTEQDGGQPEALFHNVLAFVTNAEEEGLVILPTHRLIHSARLPSVSNLRAVLKRDFRVSLYSLDKPDDFFAALHHGPDRRIGCVLAGSPHYWLLTFDERITHGLETSPALRALDVTVLHDVIFERFLGLTPELQKTQVSYSSDTEEALEAIKNTQCQAVFFLNSTPYDQVAQVCAGGETMPQKSTYFYPKLLTGLVFYSVADGEG